MATNKGYASWKGLLKEGSGTLSTQSKVLDAGYSFASRFGEDNTWTNPEELIAAAHAACFSMFLASLLEKENYKPEDISTTVTAQLSKDETGPFISKLHVDTEGKVPGIAEEDFIRFAEKAKENCPVSRALKSVPDMTLTASLRPG